MAGDEPPEMMSAAISVVGWYSLASDGTSSMFVFTANGCGGSAWVHRLFQREGEGEKMGPRLGV